MTPQTYLYNGKRLGDTDEKDNSLLKDKLLELTDLLEQGSITQDEYDVARIKVMAKIVAPQEEEQEEKPDAEKDPEAIEAEKSQS
ncbi:hypothetical protein OAM23_02920 [Luminiphilus sp.]|nr:hypothetical protein [Luminiphilus sp.]